LEGGPSPLPMMIATARNLEAAGADSIVMPCNTAHCWIEELRKAVNVPIVDMIEQTARRTAGLYPFSKAVGIIKSIVISKAIS